MTPSQRRRRKLCASGVSAREAVLYSRVSTEEQARSGHSLLAQLARLEQWAGAHELRVAAKHVEEGVSGTFPLAKRPALQAAIDDLKEGSLLVAYSIDRLSRGGARGVWELTEAVEAKKAAWATVQGSYDTSTATGRLLIGFLAEIALFQADLTAETTSRALQSIQERGGYIGRVPIGYKRTPGTTTVLDDGRVLISPPTWTIDPDGLRAVRMARKLRAEFPDMTYADIAEELNYRECVHPRGATWTASLARALCRPRYLERNASRLTIDVDVPIDVRTTEYET